MNSPSRPERNRRCIFPDVILYSLYILASGIVLGLFSSAEDCAEAGARAWKPTGKRTVELGKRRIERENQANRVSRHPVIPAYRMARGSD